MLVDMDGPLADFDRLFFERCAENGWLLDCEVGQQQHRFATDHIPDKVHRAAARNHVNSTRFFRDLPVTDGAVDGMKMLAEDYDVWVCTKPLEANRRCRDDKADWLIRNFGPEWERRLIITPDKSMVHGHLLVDDAPDLVQIERAQWKPVVFTMPWNGQGSKWEHLPHWAWGDRGPTRLIAGADDSMRRGDDAEH